MNYFILTQDERIPDVVEPIGISQVLKREMLTMERVDELENLDRQFPILEKGTSDYIDFIEKPISLLSNPLKQLIEKYAPRMPLKSVVLMDSKKRSQVLYWLMIPPPVACLSEQTEFHPDGTVKKLVIEEELAAPYTVFKVEGLREDYLIVNVTLAESLLRRAFRGVRLVKVQTAGRWNEVQGNHSFNY
ncbi:serine protease [Sporosarcina limicola]|uniref:Serine protease n=1 Tax=Sporosarcina limicola TaxID=34101 RepID=A0A927MRC0_9BACL|nr:serine protease [Sporosarcina limicola]MBE1555941.1 hypothetical protein [Sporosarcina limicola]